MKFAVGAVGALIPLTALAAGGYVHVPMKRNVQSLARRSDGSVDVDIINQVVQYYADISVGSSGQKLQVQIDTGSCDLWVPASGICPDSQTCPKGNFDPSKSSSFKVVGAGDFDISYVDGSGIAGDYFTDDLGIGGAKVSNLTMGLGKKVTNFPSIYGVMGIGYNGCEASKSYKTYQNLPHLMADEGLINTVGYSVWLNDVAAQFGSVLFGAIDTCKFSGSLNIVDILKQGGTYSGFFINLNGLSGEVDGESVTALSMPVPALLDTGTSLTIVTPAIWKELSKLFPEAKPSSQDQSYVVPCSDKDKKGTFTFKFDAGASIEVPLSSFVIPGVGGQPEGTCRLGFVDKEIDYVLLGDTFMRSIYAVYDLVNNQIGIAEAKYDGGCSDVIVFPSHGAHIPTSKPTATGSKTPTPTKSQSKTSKPTGTGPTGTGRPTKSRSSTRKHPSGTGSDSHRPTGTGVPTKSHKPTMTTITTTITTTTTCPCTTAQCTGPIDTVTITTCLTITQPCEPTPPGCPGPDCHHTATATATYTEPCPHCPPGEQPTSYPAQPTTPCPHCPPGQQPTSVPGGPGGYPTGNATLTGVPPPPQATGGAIALSSSLVMTMAALGLAVASILI